MKCYSHGTSKSHGVMTLFSPTFAWKIDAIDVSIDNNGRILIADIKMENLSCTITNVYCPNETNFEFYLQLSEMLEQTELSNLLMAGDFNITMDPTLDKKEGAKKDLHGPNRECMIQIQESYEMTDIW